MNIERLGLLLHKTDTAFKKELDQELDKLKLTHTDLAILMDLYQQKIVGSEQSRTMSIIASRLGVEIKPFEEKIKRLDENDWIVLIHDQVDRRRVDIFLSSKARSIIEYLQEIYKYVEGHAYKGFSEEEIQQTEALLRRIEENLKG